METRIEFDKPFNEIIQYISKEIRTTKIPIYYDIEMIKIENEEEEITHANTYGSADETLSGTNPLSERKEKTKSDDLNEEEGVFSQENPLLQKK